MNNVIMNVGGFVAPPEGTAGEWYSAYAHSWASVDAECLTEAANTCVLLRDGAHIRLHLHDICWSAEVTPELRESVRLMLIAERAAKVAACSARHAVQVAA